MFELKPCPFCGGEARIFNAFGSKISCKRCDAGVYDLFEEKAVAKWNRRVTKERKKPKNDV